jgi:hypothetical protein
VLNRDQTWETLEPCPVPEQITHAALQQPDGTWQSKLGTGALIEHQTVGQGGLYGNVKYLFVKKTNQ